MPQMQQRLFVNAQENARYKPCQNRLISCGQCVSNIEIMPFINKLRLKLAHMPINGIYSITPSIIQPMVSRSVKNNFKKSDKMINGVGQNGVVK